MRAFYAAQKLKRAAQLSVDAIMKAFRKKAIECHPDRGGSHAQMVLVNEAREVLSNPELRRRYDEARTHVGNRAAQDVAAADAAQARHRAEQYPRRWKDFEKWLNGVAEDFTSASYGSIPLHREMHFPTVGKSLSGWLFVLVGTILGGVYISTTLADFCERNKVKGIFALGLIAAPLLGGAWAGAGIHKLIGGAIKMAKQPAARQAQWQQEQEAKRAQSASPPDSPQEPRVLACERCGQKLRVPALQAHLLVKCKSCGHKFACPPADGSAPSPPSESPGEAAMLRKQLLKDYYNIPLRKSYLAARIDWERLLDSGVAFQVGVVAAGCVSGILFGVIVGQGRHPLFGAIIGPIGMAVIGAVVGPFVAKSIFGGFTDERIAFWNAQAELGPLPKGNWQDLVAARKRFLGE